jgi:hypothetical protein
LAFAIIGSPISEYTALGIGRFCNPSTFVNRSEARQRRFDLSTAQQYADSLEGMASNYAATRIAAVAREFEFETQTLNVAIKQPVSNGRSKKHSSGSRNPHEAYRLNGDAGGCCRTFHFR